MTVYYMAPDGDDNNDGSKEAPFRTLTGSLYHQYAKHSRVLPGDTLLIQPGTYSISDEARNNYGNWILSGLHGAPSAPITIAAYDCDNPPLFSDADSIFVDSGCLLWEPHHTPEMADRGIFRSIQTVTLSYPKYSVRCEQVGGYYQTGKQDYGLIHYYRFEDFSSLNLRRDHLYDQEKGTVQYIPHYAGPGLFFQPLDETLVNQTGTSRQIEGHLYIRLVPTFTQTYLQLASGNLNPNGQSLKLCLPRLGTLLIRNCAYLNFKNLQFADPGLIKIQGNQGWQDSHHLTFHNLTIPRGTLSRGGGIISIGLRCHDLTFSHAEINGGFPSWVYWTDVKHGPGKLSDENSDVETSSSLEALGPAEQLHGCCIRIDSANLSYPATNRAIAQEGISNIEVRDCEFKNAFFGIQIGYGARKIKLHNNQIHHIHNDGITIASAAYDVNIYNNHITESLSGISSISPNSAQNRIPPRKLGTVFIHHNVIVTATKEIGFGRIGSPENYLDTPEARSQLDSEAQEQLGGFRGLAPFGGHGNQFEAWAVYNNTLIFDQTGACGALRLNLSSEIPYYFFNNIVWQQYPKGLIMRDIDITTPRISPFLNYAPHKQIADGNLYWRTPGGTSNAWINIGNNDDPTYQWIAFPSLEDYLNPVPEGLNYKEHSATYHDLRFPEFGYPGANYEPGFDANSMQRDPRLNPLDFRPLPDSTAVNQAGINLQQLGCAQEWPMTDSNFIGALQAKALE